MEKLEIKTDNFDMEPNLRCQGSCKGACNCPKGHCKCNMYEGSTKVEKDVPSPKYFTKYCKAA